MANSFSKSPTRQLTSVVHFLDQWNTASPKSFAYVSGVLPPAISALFGYLLPHLFRWLSKYQGATTQSRLDRAVVARYYGFLVVSQLIIFTLIGVIFSMSPVHSSLSLTDPVHSVV